MSNFQYGKGTRIQVVLANLEGFWELPAFSLVSRDVSVNHTPVESMHVFNACALVPINGYSSTNFEILNSNGTKLGNEQKYKLFTTLLTKRIRK